MDVHTLFVGGFDTRPVEIQSGDRVHVYDLGTEAADEVSCCSRAQTRIYRSRMLEMPCSCTLPCLTRGLDMSLLAKTTMAVGTVSGHFALRFAARYDDAKGTDGLEVSLGVGRVGSSRVFKVERQNQARLFWLRSLCGEKSRIGKQTLLVRILAPCGIIGMRYSGLSCF